MNSIAGQLLVASRHLRDPNFLRSVVLIVQHDQEGALGVILNRPGETSLSQVWEHTDQDPCDNSQMVFVGGPVPGPLMALHTLEQFSEIEVLPGLYFSTHRDALNYLVRHETPFRILTGHAGWGAGQLESELEVGGWLTSPARFDDIWDDPLKLWKTVTGRIGLGIITPGIDARHVPEDPNWN